MGQPIRTYDIVIIGAGPVGLLLSVCLSRWGYNVRHIDNRPVPTKTGRADGIQPRTLEILKNLGLKRDVMAFDPARVFEVAFWDPQSGNEKTIVRTGTWASCPSFLDARYPFTALLHQGLIERVMIKDLAKNGMEVDRPWTITRFETNHADSTYPVEVDLKSLDSNVTETVRAKYLFSGEGAKSFVREQLQIPIRHKDPISHVWGVMDGVVRTNFPDIKMKCTIHSDAGSIMVIPREANMVRLYIQIASSNEPNFDPRKTATVAEVQDAARRIFQPYSIDWDRVEWYSVYPIGQGLADKYTLDHRVFMGGDVCHTHSPKAGQGMNTAFHDAINFAWKLHLVEAGFATRSILETYEPERRSVAETLLDFDNKYAALFSKRQPSHSEVSSAHDSSSSTSSSEAPNEFVETFKANCEFTAGYGVAYTDNILIHSSSHPFQHALILLDHPKLRPGRILPNSNVTRVVDANVMHLEASIPFNGSFRLFVFGGSHTSSTAGSHKALTDLAKGLQSPSSFYTRFSPTLTKNSSAEGEDVDTHHEMLNPHSPFFSVTLTLASPRSRIEISDLPPFFQDYRDHIYADDIWDAKVPEDVLGRDAGVGWAHAKTGLVQAATMGAASARNGETSRAGELDSRTGEASSYTGGKPGAGEAEVMGCVVVVRPDGHVGVSVKLVEGNGTVEALEGYFAGFVTDGKRTKQGFGGMGRQGGAEYVGAKL